MDSALDLKKPSLSLSHLHSLLMEFKLKRLVHYSLRSLILLLICLKFFKVAHKNACWQKHIYICLTFFAKFYRSHYQKIYFLSTSKLTDQSFVFFKP